ncbi:ABC transporter ATP-binding protein [Companilactobacillus sp. HBUAS56257]|jgi:ABC-type multidrug transport system fused ATPase/permease subunit|uniref:ABC transporter ATP-binding protein n=1 Tax=Companilactobacillus sp. HBUAS56257 TaxID=3109360 RepID=UPI002FF31579
MIYKNFSHFKYFWLNVFGLVYSAENIIMAYIVGNLTNMATNKEFNAIPSFLFQILVALLLVLVSNLSFNYLKADAIKQTNITLRSKVLKGMLTRSKENSSDLGFLTNDFKLLETNRYEAEIQILINTYTVILALLYAFYLNWSLTLVFLVGSILPSVVSNFFQKPIQKSSNEWSKANDNYVNQTKYTLAGTETFNLYHKQGNAVRQNSRSINTLEEKLARMNLLKSNTDAFLNVIAIVGTFLLPFSIGIILVINGKTSLGALFAIVQLSNSFTNPILQILNERNNLSTTKDIVKKIDGFVHEINSRDDSTVTNFDELQIHDISLSRQGKKLANEIDLLVKKGQKIAIVGPSGSGKSTLLNFLLYGTYGKAQDVFLNQSKVDPGSFTNLFSCANQKTVIFPDTLWFNLTLGARVDKNKVIDLCKSLDLTSLIEEKGFNYQLGNNADQLSGGQLSRIGLARAILAERPILLLDEINASLDKKTSQDIHRYLFESKLTFMEVNHHYSIDELNNYNSVIDLS